MLVCVCVCVCVCVYVCVFTILNSFNVNNFQKLKKGNKETHLQLLHETSVIVPPHKKFRRHVRCKHCCKGI